MTRFFHSIRWRVQIWHGIILLLAVLAFCFTAYKLAWDYQLRRIDKDLTQTERQLFRSLMHAAQQLVESSASDKPGERPFSPAELVERLQQGDVQLPEDIAPMFQSHEPGYAYFVIHNREGRLLLSSPNAPPGLTPLPSLESDMNEDVRMEGRHRRYFRSSPSGFRLVVGREITPELDDMRRFTWSISALGLGIWVLGLMGGWWLAGRAIHPIENISRTASRIAEGNLQERIDLEGTDSELDQLSHVLNQTFERLHSSFERQKQFTADASHELRTPVTILLSETQRILKRSDRTEAEYRDAILTCQQSAQRMRHLIESLLLLSRQENHNSFVTHESCRLDLLLAETIHHLKPLAGEKSLRIQADVSPVICQGDPGSLGILANNLLANAIQHQKEGGTIRVTCSQNDSQAQFSVQDDGPGIAAADMPYLFDRFYRADKARTGSNGHWGLGLAIAKTIANNHGGDITVQSQPGEGATFTVTLPVGS